MGAVDATVHQGLGQRYKVQGYPTIKVRRTARSRVVYAPLPPPPQPPSGDDATLLACG